MGSIITLDDLQGEGFQTDAGRMSDLIDQVEEFVENYCGFRFYSHTATRYLDGTATENLLLPNPIIGNPTSVSEDGAALTQLDPSTLPSGSGDYVVYNRRPPDEDDRLYPILRKVTSIANLFDRGGRITGYGLSGRGVGWNPGQQNIKVVATWGFTQLQNGVETAPREIRWACLRMMQWMLAASGQDEEVAAGKVARFATNLRSGTLDVQFHDDATGKGPTFDPDVDGILNRYRHPLKAQRPAFPLGGA